MCLYIFFFKQKTAYELRISDWSSDVCSSDLLAGNDLAEPRNLVAVDLRDLRFREASLEERRNAGRLKPIGGIDCGRCASEDKCGDQTKFELHFQPFPHLRMKAPSRNTNATSPPVSILMTGSYCSARSTRSWAR